MVIILQSGRFGNFLDFDPDSISGLELWLDAQDNDTITVDGNGALTQWDDKSTNAHIGTGHTTGVGNPDVIDVGGRQMIEMVRANQNYVDIPDHATLDPGTGRFTLFFIYRSGESGSGTRNQMYNKGQSAPVLALLTNPNPTDHTIGFAAGDGDTTAFLNEGDIDYSDDVIRGVCLTRDGGSPGDYCFFELLTGGKSELTGSPVDGTGVNDISSADDLFIGRRGPSPTDAFFMNGEVGEVLYYSAGLTDTEINDVNNYLGAKWGL